MLEEDKSFVLEDAIVRKEAIDSRERKKRRSIIPRTRKL